MFKLADAGFTVEEWSRPTGAEAPRLSWPKTPATQAGFDSSKLDSLRERLNESEDNLHAVLVVRGGSIVFESYHPGPDERLGESLGDIDFGPDTLHDCRSVTKSVLSAVVGIAHGQGVLPNLDEPLSSFFPEYGDGSGHLDICTVRHALTMTAGMLWDESTHPYTDPRNDEVALWAADDPLDYALSRPQVAPPGQAFGYNGGLPAVLAAVVERASGLNFMSYVAEHLWLPLGVDRIEWIAHRSGQINAASGLRLTPRDMARFGQMMLDGGRSGDTQIVPSDFVSSSLTAHVKTESAFFPAEYGYLWWIAAPFPVASGNGGQRVLVDAGNQMVIVITAGLYDLPQQVEAPLLAMGEVFGALTES